MSQFNHQSDNSLNSQSAAFADCIANSKQIFELIDTILPLESCLRHQILPLKIHGNLLTVGMVEPDDKNALNFICPVATSFNYHLDFKTIDSQTHQLILSAYLKEPSSAPAGDRNQTIVDIQPDSNHRDRQKTYIDIQPDSNHRDHQKTYIDIQPDSSHRDHQKTFIDIQPNEQFSGNTADKSMTLTEMPEDFDFALNLAAQSKQEDVKQAADKSMTLTEMPSDFVSKKQSVDFHERPTMIVEDAPQINHISAEPKDVKLQDYQVDEYGVLEITAEPVIESKDFLDTLNSQFSYRELLVKVLDNDVDTLQLVRHSDRGRIICSKNNSLKSSLDRVAIPIFQTLIDEIKTLAQIPLATLTSNKKVAMERFHQQERIIFRLEFIPNQYGEEIIIHILRGNSLLAYEKQQIDKLSQQALNLAQKLEKTLKKMNLCFSSARPDNMRDLRLVQQKIDRHLKSLDK